MTGRLVKTMRKTLLSVMVLLAGMSMVIAGCAPSAVNAQAPVQTNQVTMPVSYEFVPAVIQVTVGETVTWTNKDNFTHDVHILGGINWMSQPLHPGMSASYTFTKAGDFPYTCDFHSQQMKGEVIVVTK